MTTERRAPTTEKVQVMIDAAGGIPSGVIVMWHGTIASIPSGWVICDGLNSTPNLLAKFVEGVATAATNPGVTGGEATHTLIESEMPRHDHKIVLNYDPGSASRAQTADGTVQNRSDYTGYAGSDGTHENKPPFYDVAFLMKT